MTVQIDMAVRHRVGIQELSGVVLVDSQQGGGSRKANEPYFSISEVKMGAATSSSARTESMPTSFTYLEHISALFNKSNRPVP